MNKGELTLNVTVRRLFALLSIGFAECDVVGIENARAGTLSYLIRIKTAENLKTHLRNFNLKDPTRKSKSGVNSSNYNCSNYEC